MGECDAPSYHVMQKLCRDRRFKVRVSMALHSIFGKPYSKEDNDHFMKLGFMTGLDDEAVEFMAEGYEKAFARSADPEAFRNRRHRIEHASLCDQDLIDRMVKMNLCPSVNAGMVQMLGASYMKFFGERFHYIGALRSMLDAGLIPSLHSDAPSGPVGLQAIDGCVNRIDRVKNIQCPTTQAVTALEAIRVATYNGAYSTHEEDSKGSIEVGKLADLIVLSDDILAIPPKEIYQLKVDLTMIDGEVVYLRR